MNGLRFTFHTSAKTGADDENRKDHLSTFSAQILMDLLLSRATTVTPVFMPCQMNTCLIVFYPGQQKLRLLLYTYTI